MPYPIESLRRVNYIMQLLLHWLTKEDLPPQWYVQGNQHNNPLNFSHSSLRNLGVVALVTTDAAKAPNLERGPQLLQILLGPLIVDYPNEDNNNDDTGMNN